MLKIHNLSYYTSGSNFAVFLCEIDSPQKVLLKVIPKNLTREVFSLIKQDYTLIRKLYAQSNNIMPKNYYIGRLSSLQIDSSCNEYLRLPKGPYVFCCIEEYKGETVRNFILTPVQEENLPFKEFCIEFISNLPENIPLDININNIAYDPHTKKLCLIDYFPSFPWKYRGNTKIQHELCHLFPTLVPKIDDHLKKKRYFNKSYRIAKFIYYWGKYYANIETCKKQKISKI